MPSRSHLPTLPLHLALTLLYTQSWPIALQCANDGLLPLKKKMAKKLAGKKQPKKLAKNLHKEAKKRSADLLQAIGRYTESGYHRDLPEAPCIWQEGNARLLDYGIPLPIRGRGGVGASTAQTAKSGQKCPPPNLPPTGGGIILFIPSLINRYYILDLEKERSLLRFLATQGIHPLVLDWGSPGAVEKSFGIEEYVTRILLPAIDFLHRTSGMKVALGGYCMGGVLALAAAQLRPKKVEKLALFATPWDFHCKAFAPFVLDGNYQKLFSSLIAQQSSLPAEIIQALFYITDPFVFEEKFRRFLSMDKQSRAARDFIALEQWVNDGVPMTARVAHDCLIGWAQENQLMVGGWWLMGKKIDPRKITQPTFIAIPRQDHVVPHDCALSLADALPHATIITPSSGHVGMIVGSRAKSECWDPLVEWLQG